MSWNGRRGTLYASPRFPAWNGPVHGTATRWPVRPHQFTTTFTAGASGERNLRRAERPGRHGLRRAPRAGHGASYDDDGPVGHGRAGHGPVARGPAARRRRSHRLRTARLPGRLQRRHAPHGRRRRPGPRRAGQRGARRAAGDPGGGPRRTAGERAARPRVRRPHLARLSRGPPGPPLPVPLHPSPQAPRRAHPVGRDHRRADDRRVGRGARPGPADGRGRQRPARAPGAAASPPDARPGDPAAQPDAVLRAPRLGPGDPAVPGRHAAAPAARPDRALLPRPGRLQGDQRHPGAPDRGPAAGRRRRAAHRLRRERRLPRSRRQPAGGAPGRRRVRDPGRGLGGHRGARRAGPLGPRRAPAAVRPHAASDFRSPRRSGWSKGRRPAPRPPV